jgi:biotin-(acetyl-CoA carboxylase) ligase
MNAEEKLPEFSADQLVLGMFSELEECLKQVSQYGLNLLDKRVRPEDVSILRSTVRLIQLKHIMFQKHFHATHKNWGQNIRGKKKEQTWQGK